MSAPPWIQTVSGVAFDLLAPRVEDVKIEDIATALCRINRYAGHTLPGLYFTGYSVAQHSVHVSEILETWGASVAIVREGLLHDAPEAYYGDVSSPVQRAIRETWRTQIGESILLATNETESRVGDPVSRLAMRAIIGGVRAALETSDPFQEMREVVDLVVRLALGLPQEEHALVKRADLVALACERAAVMAPCDRDWQLPEFPDRRWSTISPSDPLNARASFMRRLEELDARIGAGAA